MRLVTAKLIFRLNFRLNFKQTQTVDGIAVNHSERLSDRFPALPGQWCVYNSVFHGYVHTGAFLDTVG